MMRIKSLTLVLFLALAACSPAAGLIEPPGDRAENEAPAAEDIAGAPEAPLPAATQPASTAGGAGPDFSPLSFVAPGSRMVIKDAEMELLVANTDIAVANVTQLAADAGGYIISAQTWFLDGYKHASLRLAVPVLAFESTLNTLRLFGLEVLKETASGQDVTAEYVDLESRLENLEATAARVRGFLEAAETVEEALSVNAQLASLEEQIEVIKGQLRFYESRAAFSTVTVLLTPEFPPPTPTPTPTPGPAWNPGETFGEASGTLIRLVQVLADVLIWVIVVPGPFLAVAGLALLGVRRRRPVRRLDE